jgi:hypothetical protein
MFRIDFDFVANHFCFVDSVEQLLALISLFLFVRLFFSCFFLIVKGLHRLNGDPAFQTLPHLAIRKHFVGYAH